MKRFCFKKGGILVYAMILSVAMGFISISLMTPAAFEGPKVAREEKDLRMFFAANTGLELLRGAMFYDNRVTFADYLNADLSNKVFNFDGINVTFNIENNQDDTWGTQTSDRDGILVGSATAYESQVNQSAALRVHSQLVLLQTSRYGFASNNWGNGVMGGEQHWYGDVFWYTGQNTRHPEVRGKSYFHGSLTSWDFTRAGESFYNKRNIEYMDTFRRHQAYTRDNNPTSGFYYDQNSERISGVIQPSGTFSGAKEFGPLPGLDGIKDEIGHNVTTPGTIRHAAWNQLVQSASGEMVRPYYFDTHATTKGPSSGSSLPSNVELHLSPDGAIWWRPRAGLPGEYDPNAAGGPGGGGPGGGPPAGDDNDRKWRKTDMEQSDGLVIYVAGNMWISGVVNSRMTFASGNDIYINGNIINSDWDEAHLLLMAEGDINQEVRKEFRMPGDAANRPNHILKIRREGRGASPVSVNVNQSRYVANPIFTQAEYEALMNSADTPAWYKAELQRWMEYPGALSPTAIIESSLIGKIISPTIWTNWTTAQNTGWWNNTHDDKFHKHSKVPGASWRVSGTYYIFGPEPYDYVEHWSYAEGGTATYHEHIGAASAMPPFGLAIGNQMPIYRSNGYFWRVERIPAPSQSN